MITAHFINPQIEGNNYYFDLIIEGDEMETIRRPVKFHRKAETLEVFCETIREYPQVFMQNIVVDTVEIDLPQYIKDAG